MFLDNRTGSVTVAAVDHGVGNLLYSNQFLRHQPGPDITDFWLPAQKQTLNLPKQDSSGLERRENQVDGNPVGHETDHEAAQRQQPGLRIAGP